MSLSPTYSPSSIKSHASTPQVGRHTCEPLGTSCQQMVESQNEEGMDVCFTQWERNTFSLRTACVNRRHSADGGVTSGSRDRLADSDRFHPYHRQFSDGAVAVAGCLQERPPSSYLQELRSPDTCSHSEDGTTAWDQYNGSIQVSGVMVHSVLFMLRLCNPTQSDELTSSCCNSKLPFIFSNPQSSYTEIPTAPVEPSCFLSQNYASYNSSSPLQQVSSRLYPNSNQSTNTKYSLSTQSHKDQSLFPKPIYSYSILIFMALKNSKTGSLPVSEIYSFMTEHFPYFKTAPDGWKNSVRHNLSLNKCFEKVENKNGNTSRKGCLWALNPAKVEKMQEELHKWRRKDPISVRRSMARPEDLDRLLGERPDKLRSLPPYTSPAPISRMAPLYRTASSSCTPAQVRRACQPVGRSHYARIQPQQPCYFPPATPHPSNSFAVYSPCGQQPAAGDPSATGSLNSPMPGRMPPVYNAALQDLLLEGDASYDIDTLNPTLIDLQLQGNLWEELREDSLVLEPQVSNTALSACQHSQDSCQLQLITPPLSESSAEAAGGQCKAEYEDEEDTGTGRDVGQHGRLNGLHPVVYSGVESLAGYLTSCTTSISLM
ncbi:forkhead box protein N1 [Mugil cephalus]|uniref:forkhead box protein N1 n=1 Tax=Mugil cephalus TaxID=48193 RepID=UPI001FB5AE93|nr:forkhead box protein N1 [Mugil cephalus]